MQITEAEYTEYQELKAWKERVDDPHGTKKLDIGYWVDHILGRDQRRRK